MSVYKRFISYIFNYENGIKKENVGYARIENYNAQCRISIYMKVANKREQKAKVYLFYRKLGRIKGIFIKEMLIKDGVGNCKIITESANVGNSGFHFEDIGGIVVYVTASRFFGTEWDDKPIYGFEPELEREEVVQNEIKQKEPLLFENENLKKEENQVIKQKSDITKLNERVKQSEKISLIETIEIEEKPQAINETEIENKMQEVSEKVEVPQKTSVIKQLSSLNKKCEEEQFLQAAVLEHKQTTNWSEECREEEKRYFENVVECEQEKKDYFDNYTKIYPFYETNKECIGICPKDLETISPILKQWENNEFLLYGYGRFRHILLLRKRGEKEEYFIGVPGMCRPREEKLATTYGFSMFVPMKKKKVDYGDFGYWCTMVEIQ